MLTVDASSFFLNPYDPDADASYDDWVAEDWVDYFGLNKTNPDAESGRQAGPSEIVFLDSAVESHNVLLNDILGQRGLDDNIAVYLAR